MANELREFVYLDTMSVNSLLASQYVAIPESVRDVSEDIEGEESSRGINFNLGYGPAQIGADASSGENEQARRLSETERRINEQYRFSILHQVLDNDDQIVDLEVTGDDGTAPSFSAGDIVKVSGKCSTDPIYRVLSAIDLMFRVFDMEGVAEEVEGDPNELIESTGETFFGSMRDVLHGERIGLRLEPDEFSRPVVMSLDMDNMWVSAEREFLGTHDYTVVGRVDKVMPGSDNWDFIDLLQIMDTVFSEEDIDNIRDGLADLVSNFGEGGDEDAFTVDLTEDDFVVTESAVVVSPVAIYW
jgi:hypothetical protein